MIPENIAKEHLLQAIKEIDEQGIRKGRQSSTYDLVYNDKLYPPKLVISIASRFANGVELNSSEFEGGKETSTFKFLEKEGFVIIPKNDPIRILIEKYKKHISTNRLKDEIYKWELTKNYNGRPNINALNFNEEIKNIKYGNLIYAMGSSVLHHLTKEKPEELRSLFKILFNEDIELIERVATFNKETLQIYRELGETLQHHQDERTISTYLTFYNSEKYTFYKSSYYKQYCNLLGIKEASVNEKYAHYLELINSLIVNYIKSDNELIKLVKNLIPEYYDGTNNMILAQDILYQMFDKAENVKFWRIGTTDGEGTSLWEEMKLNNRISIGWKETGNLNDYNIKNKDDVYKIFENFKYQSDNKTRSRKAGEMFNFYNKIKIGDVILAQNGQNILAIGKIVDEYFFDASSGFPHTKPVNWIVESPNLINKEGNLSTVCEIKNFDFIEKIEILLNGENSSKIAKPSIKLYKMKNNLNTILFGPPGTGKTFNTIIEAIKIIDPIFFEKNIDKYELLHKRFEELLYSDKENPKGQIAFCTFHQSFSYEDFIEGIKPLKPINNDSPIQYDVVPGIFKILCKKACNNESTKTFDSAYEDFKNDLIEKEFLELKTPTKGNPFKVRLNSNGNCACNPKTEVATEMTVTKSMISDYIFNGIITEWKPYLIPICNYIKDNYEFSKEEQHQSQKKFVLIIDEINRGNVSQIFGELITLIEENKRIGNEEQKEITLPYSKEKFGVPSNLYIIGTMNTADRSVEALDAALRRRFCFMEMPPKYDLKELQYDVFGFKAFEILQTINNRIEKLLDKDHAIGHSYFILKKEDNSKEMLQRSFYNKIIPLLQEYFFGDYGKIGLVLGEGFIQKKEWKKETNGFAKFDYANSNDYDEKDIYQIIDYQLNSTESIIINNIEMNFEKAIRLLMNFKIE